MVNPKYPEQSKLLFATNAEVNLSSGFGSRESRNIILANVADRFGRLPKGALDHEPFETPDGRVRAERLEQDVSDIWALRFSDPDKETPGRDWRVEFTSTVTDSYDKITCRLSCFSYDENFSFIPSTPGVLKKLVKYFNLKNSGFSFLKGVRNIGDDITVDDCVSEVLCSSRWWNVIVVSESIDVRFGIDYGALAHRLLGVANVYYLPLEHESSFEALIGKDFAVYGGAARTFRSRFDPLDSPITSHPVLRAPLKDNKWLIDRAYHILGTDAFSATLRRPNYREDAPGFFEVRQLVSRKRADVFPSKSEESEEIKVLRDAISAATEEAETATELGLQAEQERSEAEEAASLLKTHNFILSQRIRVLESKLSGANSTVETEEPTTYDQLANWVRENLAGRLRLDPRAERSLKKAAYEEVADVVSGLRVLAHQYVDMRTGVGSRQDFDEALRGLRMKFSGSISASRAGEQGDEYFIKINGRKEMLDFHLTKGTSHDPRQTLRIYFTYDEDAEEVVVGWLPSHLNNRLS